METKVICPKCSGSNWYSTHAQISGNVYICLDCGKGKMRHEYKIEKTKALRKRKERKTI